MIPRPRRVNKTELLRLLQAGLSDREIAKILDFCLGTIRSARRLMGIPGKRQPFIDAKEALRLWHEGHSKAEIARRFGASAAGVSCALERVEPSSKRKR